MKEGYRGRDIKEKEKIKDEAASGNGMTRKAD